MEPSEEMYKRLIEPIEDRMISIVTRIIGDHHDSLDVFQEILAVIWIKLKKIDRHPNPQAYILRICMSRSYDALRRKARRRREVRLEKHIADLRQQSGHKEPEVSFAIREAISLLPPKQGKAVLLRLIEGEDFATMGSILGCSPVTARSHFSKGRTQLRTILLHWGICPERNA